jgi:hypothetical protein
MTALSKTDSVYVVKYNTRSTFHSNVSIYLPDKSCHNAKGFKKWGIQFLFRELQSEHNTSLSENSLFLHSLRFKKNAMSFDNSEQNTDVM